MTVTLHFQSTGTVPGNAQPVRMLGGSMTIGRADVNDMVLPDPEKMISGRHCAIEDQEGNLVVIDLSTNGTFLNYGKMPLGATPTPLNNGDILSIGPYELLVEITVATQAPAAPMPAASSPGRDADMADLTDPLGDVGGEDDFLDSLLGAGTSGPSSVRRDQLGDDGLMPPLGQDDDDDFLALPRTEDGEEHAPRASSMSDVIRTPAPATSEIPDDWDLDLDLPGAEPEPDDDPFGEPEEAAPVAEPPDPTSPEKARGAVEEGATVSLPQPQAPAEPAMPEASLPQSPAASSPAAVATGDTTAARAFLSALGADNAAISDADLTATMERLGGVLNTMITGIREILMTRQSIKSEFRINQTVISAGANNPLKFSVSVDQAIEAMTRPQVKGYLPAAEAAREALDDIKAHEVAMMTGMQAALKGVLAELEPSKLSERIAADKSLLSVLSNKKARYWDVFEAQYDKISDQAENDFHELFSKEFARAYQAQLERLKKQ